MKINNDFDVGGKRQPEDVAANPLSHQKRLDLF
jgi:hypothetical protein